jgi:tripartite-type tricarboxylate transporter receptor subunit TctC
MRMKQLATAWLVAAGVAAFADAAGAQTSVEQFYAGKSITLYIGYAAGGGYDAYGRLLSKYMSRHIPGNPTIIPQNMDGAGGLRTASYLFTVAPKDGTAIGTFGEFLTIAPLLGTPAPDMPRFSWIGSVMKETKGCVFSTSSPIHSWDDMLTKEHIVGGQASGTEIDIITNTIRGLFHTKTKVVTGYHGQREIMLALEKGEVDGGCGQSYESFTSVYGNLVQRNVAKMVVYASPESPPELKGVPNAFDFAVSAEQKGALNFIFGMSGMSRAFMAPPDIPAERKAALRKAFDDTMIDPEFLSEAEKRTLEVNPSQGSKIEAALRDIYATPKDVIERAAQMAMQ